jgi:hypothetical protein
VADQADVELAEFRVLPGHRALEILVGQVAQVEQPGHMLLGLLVGIIARVGPYLLVPMAMKTLQGVDYWAQEVPIAWDWTAHLVFGASFALYPLVRKRLER